MRIEYNILWFENEERWLKPTQKDLSNFLDDNGFILNVALEKDDSNLESIIASIRNNLLDVDIVFMDYRLAQGTKGETIIEAIRNVDLFTEILFYSYQTNVKDVIEEEIGSVEGIYYAGRDTFLDKAKTVIKHTIKKVQEINSMRGLIMSAVSDLDHLILEIIDSFYESPKFSDEVKAEISERIFDEVGTHVESKKKAFDKYLRNSRIDRIRKDNVMFDTGKKAFALQCIIDKIENENVAPLQNEIFYNSYSLEVIGVRNNFAHVIEIIEEGKRKLKSRSSEEVFTDERCIEIRKNLIKHIANIEMIKPLLSD